MSKLFTDLKTGQNLYIISKVNNQFVWFIETIISVIVHENFGVHTLSIEASNDFSFHNLPLMYSKYNINNQIIYTEKEDFIEDLKHKINESILELHNTMNYLNNEIHSFEIALEKIKNI